jgi:hypothetical protein
MRRFPPSIPPIKLELSPRALKSYKNQAKAFFPKELLGYLLGHDIGSTIIVSYIWVPEDQIAAKRWVQISEHFDWEAADLAADEDLQVVGDIHSHPNTNKELRVFRRLKFTGMDLSPSQGDWDSRLGCRWITGICGIDQLNGGTLRSSVRFWAPMQRVEEVVI